jgi:hypothetical protein
MRRTILTALFIVALVNPALAGTGRCTTYYERTLDRWQTLCDDGTRAVSRYNKVLDRFETTITASPRPDCRGHLNPRTQHVEIRCR